jgi:hypothetical protein
MVEGNMGKFESQIFLLNTCVLLRHESIIATPDPILLSLALLRG